jgi:hypothetical protein
MNNRLAQLLMIILVGFSSAAYSQTAKCEQSIDIQPEQLNVTRGISKVPAWRKKVKKRRFLRCPDFGKTRGYSGCNIIIKNEGKQEVDVFLYEEYYGSIKAGETAIIDKLQSYGEISVFSLNDKIMWKAKGDCNCKYSFNLKSIDGAEIKEAKPAE